MVNLKSVATKEEFEKEVEALTSIFIEEYPYYSTYIAYHNENIKNKIKK